MTFEQDLVPDGSPSSQNILWRQVWGVAALLGVILFSFMAYGLYQPIILNNLGFGELAAWLGLAQGLLGAVLEPLMGLTLASSSSVFLGILTLGIGIALGGVFINQIPFCLSRVPAIHAGLGTGLYFGGMGAATAIVSLLMKLPPGITPETAGLWVAIAWLFTIPCLAVTSRASSN